MGAKHTKPSSQMEPAGEAIERLYIELDGVRARLRRGSVPMEHEEQPREGEVYREIKTGAVFRSQRGCERSALVEGEYVDEPVPGRLHSVARRTALGHVGEHLDALAVSQGLARSRQVVVRDDGAPWRWRLAEEHFPDAVQIVDVFHAKPPVWEVASAVFGRSPPRLSQASV